MSTFLCAKKQISYKPRIALTERVDKILTFVPLIVELYSNKSQGVLIGVWALLDRPDGRALEGRFAD